MVISVLQVITMLLKSPETLETLASNTTETLITLETPATLKSPVTLETPATLICSNNMIFTITSSH